ncbi:hypothetical protein R1sor_017750 [Riccia sorocarpa]|uniref:Uncharacterized protein n=1 Tax=Riccia sorocarpa TaxID=122646 RepID=A0ABD3I7Y7_9MARC
MVSASNVNNTDESLDKFCAAWWNFDRGSIYLNERTEVLEREAEILVNQSETGFWKLRVRASYVVFGSRADHPSVLKESSLRRSTLEDGASRTASLLQCDGVTYDENVISGYEACLRIDGTSELSKLDLSSFVHQRIGGKKSQYAVNKIHCVGSLKCVNDVCPYLLAEKKTNEIDWPADRLGTPDAFEKAFDSAVRQTEPLKDVQATINGDLATKTQKRKTPVTNTIHAEDTHRHDRIAVTAQVQRRVRSRLEFDIGDIDPTTPGNFEAGQSAPQGRTVNDPADITTISTSSDISTPDIEDNVVNNSRPIVTEEGEQDPNPVPIVDFVEPISDTESEVEIIGQTRQQARHSTEDDEEPDVVIIRVTPRSRPPTRQFPRPVEPVPPPIQIRQEGEITQFGLSVQEQNVDRRFWHLSRINPAGNPACNAAMTGRGAPRSVCKTKIKIAGLTVRGFGTVAPSFVGFTRFQGIEQQNQFWFCPEYVCVKS